MLDEDGAFGEGDAVDGAVRGALDDFDALFGLPVGPTQAGVARAVQRPHQPADAGERHFVPAFRHQHSQVAEVVRLQTATERQWDQGAALIYEFSYTRPLGGVGVRRRAASTCSPTSSR